MLPVSVHVSRLLSRLENTTRLSGSIKGVNHSWPRYSLVSRRVASRRVVSCRVVRKNSRGTRTIEARFTDADRAPNGNRLRDDLSPLACISPKHRPRLDRNGHIIRNNLNAMIRGPTFSRSLWNLAWNNFIAPLKRVCSSLIVRGSRDGFIYALWDTNFDFNKLTRRD